VNSSNAKNFVNLLRPTKTSQKYAPLF